MSNNIFEKMTNQMHETVDSSVALALHNKNQEVEVIHLLWALLTNTNSVLNQLLNKMNVNKCHSFTPIKAQILMKDPIINVWI